MSRLQVRDLSLSAGRNGAAVLRSCRAGSAARGAARALLRARTLAIVTRQLPLQLLHEQQEKWEDGGIVVILINIRILNYVFR